MKKINALLIITLFVLCIFSNSCTQTQDPIINTTAETVTDIDGNVYKTVKIGTQTWMAENLRVTKYSNGTIIPSLYNTSSNTLKNGGYADYNNNYNNHGYFYDWYAVSNSQNIAPNGWHVPSATEWDSFSKYSGDYIPFSFSAVYWSGILDENCKYYGDGANPGGWWSSTEYSTTNAKTMMMDSYQSNGDASKALIGIKSSNSNKFYGLSVRCVKD